MYANPSPNFLCMPSNFVAHANENKRRTCWDGGGQAGLVGWCMWRLGLPPYIWKHRATNSQYIYTHEAVALKNHYYYMHGLKRAGMHPMQRREQVLPPGHPRPVLARFTQDRRRKKKISKLKIKMIQYNPAPPLASLDHSSQHQKGAGPKWNLR